MSYLIEPSPSELPSSSNGTIIYTLIYSITGEGKEAKEEIVREIAGRRIPYMKNVIKMRSQSVMELESLESALRLYGDWYSGKLYDLPTKKSYLHAWREQVEAKLQLLADLYEMTKQVTEARFGLTLEFLVVVLIVLEIVLALAKIH